MYKGRWLLNFVFLFGLSFLGYTANPPSQIFVSPKWTEKIKEHLLKIERNGWGQVVPGDLYHGHLIMKENINSTPEFSSVDELFDASALILYHSDEMLERWLGRDGRLPVEKRTPRSIIGYWDGNIVTATSLVKNPLKARDYYGAGTIHSDELTSEMQGKLAFWWNRDVKTSKGTCQVNLIVDISICYDCRVKPNMTIGNRSYVVSLSCGK